MSYPDYMGISGEGRFETPQVRVFAAGAEHAHECLGCGKPVAYERALWPFRLFGFYFHNATCERHWRSHMTH